MIKLSIDTTRKVFFAEVKGNLNLNEIQDYIIDLEDKIKKYDTTQYAFIIDAREQMTLAPDLSPLLEKCMKLYTSTPFKKRVSVVLDSAVAMLQVKKVANAQANEFIMVTSKEEAFKML